jgi:hypothetical protein
MATLKHTQFMQGLKEPIKHYLPPEYQQYRLGETRWLFQIYFGDERRIHYEVSRVYAKQGRMLEIGLHFESRNRKLNHALLRSFQQHLVEVWEKLGDQVIAEQWDRGWTKVYEAYPDMELTDETLDFAAQRLARFVTVMQPIYLHIRRNREQR